MCCSQELDPVFVSEILQTQTSSLEVTLDDTSKDITVECTNDSRPLCPRCRRFTIQPEVSVVCPRCEKVLQKSN